MRLLLALFLAACDVNASTSYPWDGGPRDASPCDACASDELCVQAADAGHVCARICVNQLHCWSSCCLREADSSYAVCRPSTVCYGR